MASQISEGADGVVECRVAAERNTTGRFRRTKHCPVEPRKTVSAMAPNPIYSARRDDVMADMA